MTIHPHEISDTLRRMLTKAGRQDLIDNGFDVHDDAVERSRHLFRGGSPDHALYHALFDRSAPHAEIINPRPQAEPAAPVAQQQEPESREPAIVHVHERDAGLLAKLAPWIQIFLLLAILLTLFSGRAHAQSSPGGKVPADPCAASAKSYYTISITTSTQVITGAALKKVYVCAVNIVAGAATNVALVEGTGSTCGTSTAGMAGGATAATGWNLAANGGLTLGNGSGTVIASATAATNVCLLVSAANQISGTIAYVVQ